MLHTTFRVEADGDVTDTMLHPAVTHTQMRVFTCFDTIKKKGNSRFQKPEWPTVLDNVKIKLSKTVTGHQVSPVDDWLQCFEA